ncbi:MAG: DUF7260 family protein, partial [Halovenus sp.]
QPPKQGAAAVHSAPRSTDGLRKVRRQYESTVMAAPHYEAEYDESYTEHVYQEFGPDIATVLVHGAALEPRQKQAILNASTESITTRETFMEALQREQESVTELREPTCSVAADIGNIEQRAVDDPPAKIIDGYLSRLEVLEKRCHDLVDQRQSEMVTERRELLLPISGPDIPSYVYQELPVSYPIISILVDLIDTARSTQRTLEARMGHRSGDTETETAMRE